MATSFDNLTSYLRSALPAQCIRLAERKGAAFTVMVAGERGTGKSTFVRTLFGSEYSVHSLHEHSYQPYQDLNTAVAGIRINDPAMFDARSLAPAKITDLHRTARVEVRHAKVVENRFETLLTIVDTPEFGDYANNENSWVPVVNYIDAQHRHYMFQEEQPRRTAITDTRVHLCLYFLAPANAVHELDLAAMRELSTRVNVVPVIGRADSMTLKDRIRFKAVVRDTLLAQGINVWIPEDATYEWPFSIVASDYYITLDNGREVRGRKYRWGCVEVENPVHSDFSLLRDQLIGKHMLDLIDDTERLHFYPQRQALRLHRLRKALNLEDPGVSTNRGTTAPVGGGLINAVGSNINGTEDTLSTMSGIEILSIISKLGSHHLEAERIDVDAVLRQRVRALVDQFNVVTRFQQEHFAAQSQQLQRTREELDAEIRDLMQANSRLEEEIKELETNKKRK